MENTNLKKGDVIAINWDGTKMLAIFEKFDTTFGNRDGLYIYAEMNMRSKELYFKPDDCDFSYELRDITYRLADNNEKNTLYDAIGKHFVEYDKYWYNHFTDSSYFDIQDYLLDVFRIKVREYDDDMIYPDFINEIHNYIWDKLCEAMGVPNTVENKPEMVNKLGRVNMKKFIKRLADGGLAEDIYAAMEHILAEDINKEKMTILDKVEEFLEGCMFNEESNNEILVIKYKTVSELINAMREFVK